jgi:hypothetical protein
MIDVTGKSHEATDVEGHPTRPHGTGGEWRNELGDAIVGAGHPHIDRRSLEMARLIVEKIDADPDLLQVAHENLHRWSRARGGALPRCREEWKALLKRPWGPDPRDPPRRIGRGAAAAEFASVRRAGERERTPTHP